MGVLDKKFEQKMWDIYHTAKKACNYNATLFMRMLIESGGVGTAKRLLSKEKIQYGFTELWMCDRLNLTVEAHVLLPEFNSLFNYEERQRAKKRLLKHDSTFFSRYKDFYNSSK